MNHITTLTHAEAEDLKQALAAFEFAFIRPSSQTHASLKSNRVSAAR